MPGQISLLSEPLALFIPINASWSSNLLNSSLHLYLFHLCFGFPFNLPEDVSIATPRASASLLISVTFPVALGRELFISWFPCVSVGN